MLLSFLTSEISVCWWDGTNISPLHTFFLHFMLILELVDPELLFPTHFKFRIVESFCVPVVLSSMGTQQKKSFHPSSFGSLSIYGSFLFLRNSCTVVFTS